MTDKRDIRLFFSLMLWMLLPSVYLLVRMHIVAVHAVDLNILGQMEWFDLIDEVISTTLIVPLYSLLKPEHGRCSREERRTNGAIFLIAMLIYTSFAVVVALHISSVAAYMHAENAVQYLLLETAALLISFVSTFSVLLFTLNSDDIAVRHLTVFKLALLALGDTALITGYGERGAAYSELIVNGVIGVCAILYAHRRGYIDLAAPTRLTGLAERLKAWAGRGAFVGVQILLDNGVYAVMICKMVNVVHESGNYWVANNFIWGWLLVPVHCLAEIVRKRAPAKLDIRTTLRYAVVIAAVWAVTAPWWGLFLEKGMAMSNADAIMAIVLPSALWYLSYIPSAICDAWFVSRGKTIYLSIISAVVNIGYYGILYVLFRLGVVQPSIRFIISMFGGGMVVHMLLSIAFYAMENRKLAQ